MLSVPLLFGVIEKSTTRHPVGGYPRLASASISLAKYGTLPAQMLMVAADVDF